MGATATHSKFLLGGELDGSVGGKTPDDLDCLFELSLNVDHGETWECKKQKNLI